MEINATLIGQMIAFAIFVWFTMKYVWPPITGAMQDRQQKIADGLAAADKGARALKDASAKSEEAMQQAREEAREIVAGANRQAGQIVEAARDTAKSEGERLKEQARGEIEQEITSARETLRKRVGELAVAGASQILGREIDGAAHGDLLDKLAGEL